MMLQKNKILFLLFCLLCNRLVAQQTERVYLSGTGNKDAKQWEFMCTGGMNANKWTTIAVPSCWELQALVNTIMALPKIVYVAKKRDYTKQHLLHHLLGKIKTSILFLKE
jgi:hypothetical protein